MKKSLYSLQSIKKSKHIDIFWCFQFSILHNMALVSLCWALCYCIILPESQKNNFIKFQPLIKSPGPFRQCRNYRFLAIGDGRTWKAYGKTRDHKWHSDVWINPKISPLQDPVRDRKNAPIDCLRYIELIILEIPWKGILACLL